MAIVVDWCCCCFVFALCACVGNMLLFVVFAVGWVEHGEVLVRDYVLLFSRLQCLALCCLSSATCMQH
eukprot:m.509729 g.509729  ORF g.509729 m.509729 type:complete len:68 (-) comp94764_c0_seq1:50-253(-)